GERTTEGKRLKEIATFEALTNDQILVIFNARIGSHVERAWQDRFGVPEGVASVPRISEPDMLVRLEDGYWYPVDVKDHKVTTGKTKKPKRLSVSHLSDPAAIDDFIEVYGQIRAEDWLQLAHY